MCDTGGSGPVRFRVDRALDGERLARAVARAGAASSVREAKWLVDLGRVFLNERREVRASAPVRAGAWVEVHRDRVRPAELDRAAILWAGESVLAIHKPAGVPVEGTRGQAGDSVLPLLDALLKREGLRRPGERLHLVHRLDRDTSGLLLVARTGRARLDLEEQFLRRRVKKRYAVLVQGVPGQERFRCAAPVRARSPAGAGAGRGSSPRGRDRTVSREEDGAETEFQVVERFPGYALLDAWPLTGRTHQIRIHLQQLGLPVLGDAVYGPAVCPDPLARAVPRQMLHAALIQFRDPDTGGSASHDAPLPEDMQAVLVQLQVRSRKPAGGR